MHAQLALVLATLGAVAGAGSCQQTPPPANPSGVQDPAVQPPPGAQVPGAPVPGDHGQPAAPSNKDRPIPPGCWFKKIHVDFGEHVEQMGENLLVGEYEFTNPSGAARSIKSVTPSCKCQRLQFFLDGKEVVLKRKADVQQSLEEPIVVPAGTTGKVVMKFDVSGAAGPRTGEIRIDTDDPAMASFTLTCEAKVNAAYVIEPPQVNLGQMAPTDQKPWSVKVRCTVRDAWQVVKALEPIPPGIKVASIERGEAAGKVVYEIKGTYGPELDEGAVGGNLVFATDDPKQNFLVEIRAEVRERIQMTPRFFSLSNFPRNQAQEKTIYLWPTDTAAVNSGFELDHVETEFASVPPQFVKYDVITPPKPATPPKMVKIEGRDQEIPEHLLWKVVCRVGADVPGNIVRVKGKIHFKGEGMVAKGFQFNGFPRAAR